MRRRGLDGAAGFKLLGLRSSADLLVSRHSLGYREGASGTRLE